MIVMDKHGQSIEVAVSPPNSWGDLLIEFEVDGIEKTLLIPPCPPDEIRDMVLEEVEYIRDTLRPTCEGLGVVR